MRSNLVPEKRRDRNGVLRTVYVRADSPSSMPPRALPPAPGPAVPAGSADRSVVRPAAVLFDMHRRRVKTFVSDHDLQPSNQLLDALARRTGEGGRKAQFEFDCTPLQFCDVLSATSPDTAVALLDAGITGSSAAEDFLEGAGMDDLIEDNGDAAAAILRTSALPEEALALYLRSPDTFYDDPDGFETQLADVLLHKLQRNRTVWKAIQDGEVRTEDILQIGVSRFLRAESNEDQLTILLAKLARDRGAPVQPEHISDWIERFAIDEGPRDNIKRLVYSLCADFGPDFASTVPLASPEAVIDVYKLVREATNTIPDRDRREEAVLFGAQVLAALDNAKVRPLPRPRDLCRLHAAGIGSQEAADACLAGLSAEQILTSHRDGIAPGLSSGTL